MSSEEVDTKIVEQPKKKVGRPRKHANDKERSDANHKKNSEISKAFTALKRQLKKEGLTSQLGLLHILSTEKLEKSLAKSMLDLYTSNNAKSETPTTN